MYPRRNPETIGVAFWSASMVTPTPAIMSVRARTTTYVSAAANATPTEAMARTALARGPPVIGYEVGAWIGTTVPYAVSTSV